MYVRTIARGQTETLPTLDLAGCNASEASGTVTNHSSQRVDIYVHVAFLDSSGVQVEDGIDDVTGLAAGGTAHWSAKFLGSAYKSCDARISSVFAR